MTFEELIKELKAFNTERDWDKYHNPKDVILALMGEVGELAEVYQWLSEEEVKGIHENPAKRKAVEEELADIQLYLITLANNTNVDLVAAAKEKLEKNKKRFPVQTLQGGHNNRYEGVEDLRKEH